MQKNNNNHHDPHLAKSRRAFNQKAAHFDTDASYEGKHSRSLYPFLLEKLAELDYHSILDVSCGTGGLLAQLPGREDRWLAGIDISPEMLSHARQKLGEAADLRVGNAEALPWEDDTFDVVVCSDSFHHYNHPRQALVEMHRVLKVGGLLLLGDFWQPTPVRQITNLIIPFSNAGDYHVYSECEICELVKESGFDSIQWQRVTNSAFVLAAR